MNSSVQNLLSQKKVPIVLLFTVFYENIYSLLYSLGVSQPLAYYPHFLCLLFSFFYILLKSPKEIISQPIIFYAIWIFYVLINNFAKGIDYWESPVYMFFSVFSSYVVLLICQYAFKRDENALTKFIIISLFFYIFLAIFHIGFSNLAFDERMDTDDVNGNALGERAAALIFFINTMYLRKTIPVSKFFALSIIPVMIVILTGSRTAFAMAFLCYIPFLFTSERLGKDVAKRIIFIVLFASVLFVIFNNTILGERLLSSDSQVTSYLETGTYWDLMGDRGYQYYISLPVIQSNFLTGIGLGNFLTRVPGALFVLHSEYLIQLLECGLVGFLLYFSVYYGIMKRISKSSHAKPLRLLCYCGIGAILFACAVTRVSFYSFFACILGYTLNFSLQKR